MKVVFGMLLACTLHAQALSSWAFPEADHRLHYRYDPKGNSIMDFSSAGYHAAEVKIPAIAEVQRLTPVPGDSTARIQAALDKAIGAVVLAAGEYEIAGTLCISRRGVVLRGEKGATIRLTGPPHRFLEIHGTGTWQENGSPVPIVDAYVPSGATRFRVHDGSVFHPGDHVLVLHPVTAEWNRFMGTGKADTWIRPGSVIRTDRIVDSVEGDNVTLDVPLSDALDSQFTAASLVRYSYPGRIGEVGVEGLRIVAPFADVPITAPQYTALSIDAVEDAWVRDVEIHETENGIEIGPGAKRLTLTNVRVVHSRPHSGAPAPADFSLRGTQILLDRCSVAGGEGTSPVVTQGEVSGPVVVLNFTADHGGIAPHQPWTTGLLVDGGKFPGGTEQQPGIAFSNGGVTASGAGWAVGWAVGWNVTSPFLLVQQPPGALNWCIGCIGTPVTVDEMPNGVFDSPQQRVEPASLYLQQLRDRLGPDGPRNIGY